ncbi:uncharacterized protein LOC113238637 [Hyposmocoma kahamanoa]|uniref:uncharacterized protein LOC113238637 n=1 Tax=Hyposmocoma kahamanoa TaxID=1477025 RepID=UPI000E6D8A2A|nr:uncharacterized protein LOC113238637 [Hyposmocoma kahamanoa]
MADTTFSISKYQMAGTISEIMKKADVAFFKEALKRPGKAGEAEPEGTAGIMSEALAQEAPDNLATILAETAKSCNLKGTVIKAIKEAVKKVEKAIDFLHLGETATERLCGLCRRMRRQPLEAEVKALRGAYSIATAKATAQVAPPPCSSAVMHAEARKAIDDLSAPAYEATPAATAVAAAAPRLLPSAAAPESTPGLSHDRNAPADPRPNKKAKRKAPPPKATAAPPAAPPAVSAIPAAPDVAASMPTDQTETSWALFTPKSSAVVITLRLEAVAENGVTYKGVLEAATAAVDLGSLGIPHVRVRNTQTSARIVEVPGATNAGKADTLAAKLEEVIGGLAAVTRPTKTANLRVTGFDESVTSEKIRTVVAAKGQCPQSAVSVGVVRLVPNGRGSALVRCPVTAAQRVTAAGRLLVGWSFAGPCDGAPPHALLQVHGYWHHQSPLPIQCEQELALFQVWPGGTLGLRVHGDTAVLGVHRGSPSSGPRNGGAILRSPLHQEQAGGDLRPPPY